MLTSSSGHLQYVYLRQHISLKTMNEGSCSQSHEERAVNERRNGGKGRYACFLADNGWSRGFTLPGPQARASDGGLWRSWLLMLDRAAVLRRRA